MVCGIGGVGGVVVVHVGRQRTACCVDAVRRFHGEPTYIFTGPLYRTVIRARARRGVDHAPTDRARRPWTMVAEGAACRWKDE